MITNSVTSEAWTAFPPPQLRWCLLPMSVMVLSCHQGTWRSLTSHSCDSSPFPRQKYGRHWVWCVSWCYRLDTWIPRHLNCLRYTEFTIRTFLICQALSSCIPKSHKKLLNLHTCLTHGVSFVNGWTPKIWTDLGGFGSFICKPLGAILPWQAMAASHIPCWHVDHEFLYQQIVRYTLNDATLSQQLHTFGGGQLPGPIGQNGTERCLELADQLHLGKTMACHN